MVMFARRRRTRLAVAIPASLTAGVPHLREKTYLVGLVGRAAAVFRVEEVVVYRDLPDVDQRGDAELMASILAYMETPQYLRKRLFGVRPELRYVGILHPLRTPHHPTAKRVRDLRDGEFREGVVVASGDGWSMVDVGVEKPLRVDRRLEVGRRVTVRVSRRGGVTSLRLARRGEVKAYWGYRVRVTDKPLYESTKRGGYDLVIATSRKGESIKDVFDDIASRWRRSKKPLIAFGSPTEGLAEILSREGVRLEDYADFVVNTVPEQGTETVRTEEAVYATLAILNLIEDKV